MTTFANLKNEFTATGYVINRSRTKTLFVFHKKLQKWTPPGGHLEKNELPHICALREVKEETGFSAFFLPGKPKIPGLPKTEVQLPTPYYILHEFIPRYKDVPEHMHIDLVYLLTVKSMRTKERHESAEIRWFSKKEIAKLNCFEAARFVASQELKGTET